MKPKLTWSKVNNVTKTWFRVLSVKVFKVGNILNDPSPPETFYPYCCCFKLRGTVWRIGHLQGHGDMCRTASLMMHMQSHQNGDKMLFHGGLSSWNIEASWLINKGDRTDPWTGRLSEESKFPSATELGQTFWSVHWAKPNHYPSRIPDWNTKYRPARSCRAEMGPSHCVAGGLESLHSTPESWTCENVTS